jgi:hypothetical protein
MAASPGRAATVSPGSTVPRVDAHTYVEAVPMEVRWRHTHRRFVPSHRLPTTLPAAWRLPPSFISHALRAFLPHRPQRAPPVAAQLAAQRAALPAAAAAALAALPLHVQAGILAASASASPSLPLLADILARVPSRSGFDAVELSEASGGAPVAALLALLFVQLGLADTFGIDLETLSRFARAVEAGMPESNPYHNVAHIADVVHSCAALLAPGGGADVAAGPDAPRERPLALLFAAAVHDLRHPGLTGDHLAATSPRQWGAAAAAGRESLLERYHLAVRRVCFCVCDAFLAACAVRAALLFCAYRARARGGCVMCIADTRAARVWPLRVGVRVCAGGVCPASHARA